MRLLYSMICSLSIATLGGIATAGAVETADINFTYATPDSSPQTPIGVGKKDMHYDVAMHLNNPGLIGYQILGIDVPIPATGGECYPAATAWLASQLTLTDGRFTPDTYSAPGSITNYGTEEAPDYRLHVDFDKPYTITTDGIYVGYTVCVKDLVSWTAKYPISVVADNNAPGSLWVHCPKEDNALNVRYLEWTDANVSLNLSSAMTVMLRGLHGEYLAAPTPASTVAAEIGSFTDLPISITNFGTQPITSIEYQVSEPDSDVVLYTATKVLETPIPAIFGRSESTLVAVPAESVEAESIMRLAITKVNGNENMATVPYNTFRLVSREHIPVRRPLIEELTGLWCKYCPEGYVILKQLRDTYSHEEAPIIAVHCQDAMTTISDHPFPTGASAPSIIIDRVKRVYNFNNLKDEWEARKRELCPVDIKVDIYWDDEEKTILRPVTTVNFAFLEPGQKYLISYALVEDDMSDPEWNQYNLPENWADREGPYWDLVKEGYGIKGLIYDDVALAMPSIYGMSDSLPEEIEAGVDYSHSTIINPAECTNSYKFGVNFGKLVTQNPDNLRVIAYICDPDTHEVYNSASSDYAAKAPVYGASGINCPDNVIAEPILVEYFTLDGMRIKSAPKKQPYIAVYHYQDGSVKSAKHLQ